MVVDPELQAKILLKQRERKESFAKLKAECILNEKAINIVQLPVEQLLARLKSCEFSASEVLKAFIAKALEVTEKFNCVTEFIPQAFVSLFSIKVLGYQISRKDEQVHIILYK